MYILSFVLTNDVIMPNDVVSVGTCVSVVRQCRCDTFVHTLYSGNHDSKKDRRIVL